MDSIELAKIDTDEDGYHIILLGDFEDTFKKYLEQEDNVSVILKIPNHVLRTLVKDINQYEEWRYA